MNKSLSKRFSVITILALMLMALPAQSAQAAPTELFFSEYIEGSSFNKALEIYNGTGAAIDLAAGAYSVQMYFNGSGTAGLTLNLTGVIADGDVYVIANSNATTPADPAILAQADLVSLAGFYNGDDAVVLRKNGINIDVIGQIGSDPGSEWGSGVTSTADNTLRRKANVCAGDPDGSNAFDPSIEWDGFAQNTFDGLGAHTATCDSTLNLTVSDVSANEGNSGTTSFDFTVSLSAPAGVGGVTFDIATADNTATVADNDYVANSVTGGSIAEGSSSYTFSVLVNGDTTVEPNETFFVNVSDVTGATVSDGQAVGTILNDDITITPIYDIQGAGHISPYSNMEVRTTGVVTAVAFNGYYMQDPVGDGDPNTSDGIFVFKSSLRPSVGDLVQLTDTVTEFVPGGCGTGNLSITQLSPTTANQVVLSSGNPLPAPTVIGLSGRIPPNIVTISDDELPVNLQPSFCTGGGGSSTFDPDNDGIDFYESLEGMLVTVEDAVAVSAVRSFGNFSSELFTLPNNGHPDIIEPNTARTDRGGINLAGDPDGYGDLNPERVQIQFDASDITTGTLYPSSVPEINLGDRLGDVTGVMDYDFGNFEVRAIEVVTVVPSGLQPESTILVGTPDHVTVASYNVLNLSPQSSDDNQRAMLASQIVNNLGSPDVIALQEIQDNSGETDDGTTAADQTLRALADAITAAGGPSYDFLDVAPADGTSGGVPGGNIRNAFLYNPDRVQLDSFVSLTPDVLTSASVGNPNAFFDNRNPLAATFIFGGEAFTVINNHLSSRSGSTPIFGGPQPFVQAAEGEREAQTQALNDYVDFLLRADKNARVIVVGDFNTFEFTDDLTEILPGTRDGKAIMKSLLSEIQDDNRYTFIFDGNSQILDHMFATRSLLENAEFDIVHVNADFALLRADIAASDHEPIVARFNFGG